MVRVSEGPIYSPAMFPLLQPVQMLLLMFAGWVNRHQLDVIEYLQEENRVLKEHLGGRRIRLTDTERCRFARRAPTWTQGLERSSYLGHTGYPLLYPITLFTADSASEECLATTIGPTPGE